MFVFANAELMRCYVPMGYLLQRNIQNKHENHSYFERFIPIFVSWIFIYVDCVCFVSFFNVFPAETARNGLIQSYKFLRWRGDICECTRFASFQFLLRITQIPKRSCRTTYIPSLFTHPKQFYVYTFDDKRICKIMQTFGSARILAVSREI